MTLTEEKMLAEFERMTPEVAIKLHIDMLEDLIPIFLETVDNDKTFKGLIVALKNSINAGRSWLRGEITDPMQVINSMEGPPALASKELDHEGSEHFGDVSLLVILAANAIYYASDIQFDRVGDSHKPQSLDYEVTSEELAEELAERLGQASSRMVQRIETLWNEKMAQI